MKFNQVAVAAIVGAMSVVCHAGDVGANAAKFNEDTVLVKWDNFALTARDVDAKLSSAPPDIRRKVAADPKRVAQLMENMQINRTLANQARKMKLDSDPDTKAKIRLAIDDVLAVARLKKFEDSLKLPDFTQAAKEQYDLNPAKFKEPDTVHAMHILIRVKGRTEEEAKKLAEDVRAKAVAGESFQELADKYSEDPSAVTNHGDLGYFQKSSMVQPFAEAAFALKEPGQISDVVRTNFGFHIIKLIDHKVGVQKSFDEVKDKIIKALRESYIVDHKLEFVSGIKNDPSIKIDDAAFKWYVDRNKAVDATRQQDEPLSPE